MDTNVENSSFSIHFVLKHLIGFQALFMTFMTVCLEGRWRPILTVEDKLKGGL